MFEKRGGRKSQVTMFVILGLVILILFLIIYFLFLRKPSIEEEFKEEPIPQEFKPVRDYIEGCVHQLGVEAIKKMGAHGGYIDPLDLELTPVVIKFNPSEPTRSDAVSFTGDRAGAVPYYLYVPGKSSYLNYQLGSVAPTIESMNYQLGAYIDRELPRCVGSFESFEQKGLDISGDNSNIQTTALIKDNKIEFYVDYKINISQGNTKITITKHQSVINFPFKKYYDLAISVMTAELVSQFMESYTNSLIAYHSGLDASMLPPPIEYSHDPYILIWSNAKTRTDLNNLLLSYTPVLQVVGTKNYQPITAGSNDVEANFYKSLSMEIFNESLPSTSITFFYVDNSLVSKVQPSKGDMIKPSIDVSEENQFVPKSQFNTYKFYYDVAYPVIVEIRGDEPEKEIPQYSFLFALESNLIESKGVLAWNLGMGTVDWDYSYLNTTYTFPDGSFYDPSGNPVPMEPRSTAKSLFCDEATWISGNVNARVLDATSGAPMEGVTISYGCGDYDECWVGITDSNGEWTGKLPICQGGYIILSKEDYGSKTITLSTEEGKDVMLTTEKLEKLREITATVKKFEIQKIYTRDDDWVWTAGADSLGSIQDIDSNNEQAIVTITQTGFEAGNQPVTHSIIFGKEGVSEQSIKLVPGEYEVTATLIDHNGVIIPANCSRVCKTNVIVCLDYEYFPSETEMKPVPWGGVEVKEGTTGTFKITAGELDNNNQIEFRILKLPNLQYSSPSGACLDALEEMNKIGDYSAKYKTEIMPVLKIV